MYYEESDIKRRIMNKFGKNSIVFNRKLNYIHAHPKEKFNSKSNILACNSMKYFANKYNINFGKFKRKPTLQSNICIRHTAHRKQKCKTALCLYAYNRQHYECNR